MTDPAATARVRLDRRQFPLLAFAGVVLGLIGSLAEPTVTSVGIGVFLALAAYRIARAAIVARFVARGVRLRVFAWFMARDGIILVVALAVLAIGIPPRTAALLLAALTLAFATGLIGWAVRVYRQRTR